MIKLDILSDPICPWCYIGKTRLERATHNGFIAKQQGLLTLCARN